MNVNSPKEISPGVVLFEMSKMMLDHENRLTAIERTVKEQSEKILDNQRDIQRIKQIINLGGK